MKVFKIQDFMDLIETLDLGFKTSNIFGAKLNDKLDNSICVYERQCDNNLCLGGRKSTKTKKAAFSLLLHWNRDYKETEEKAQEIYNKLEELATGFQFDDFTIVWLHLEHANSIDIERSADGTWERIIELSMEYYI